MLRGMLMDMTVGDRSQNHKHLLTYASTAPYAKGKPLFPCWMDRVQGRPILSECSEMEASA